MKLLTLPEKGNVYCDLTRSMDKIGTLSHQTVEGLIDESGSRIDIESEQLDIYGGGVDLIFPHHEAEIFQSESYTGKHPFSKYWLHNGFLTINKEKM